MITGLLVCKNLNHPLPLHPTKGDIKHKALNLLELKINSHKDL